MTDRMALQYQSRQYADCQRMEEWLVLENSCFQVQLKELIEFPEQAVKEVVG